VATKPWLLMFAGWAGLVISPEELAEAGVVAPSSKRTADSTSESQLVSSAGVAVQTHATRSRVTGSPVTVKSISASYASPASAGTPAPGGSRPAVSEPTSEPQPLATKVGSAPTSACVASTELLGKAIGQMYHWTSDVFCEATVVTWKVLFPPSDLSEATVSSVSAVAFVGGAASGPKFSAVVGSAALAGVATNTSAATVASTSPTEMERPRARRVVISDISTPW
jgi:hypothetical protein